MTFYPTWDPCSRGTPAPTHTPVPTSSRRRSPRPTPSPRRRWTPTRITRVTRTPPPSRPIFPAISTIGTPTPRPRPITITPASSATATATIPPTIPAPEPPSSARSPASDRRKATPSSSSLRRSVALSWRGRESSSHWRGAASPTRVLRTAGKDDGDVDLGPVDLAFVHMLDRSMSLVGLCKDYVCDAPVDGEEALLRDVDALYFAIVGEDFVDVLLSDVFRQFFNHDFGAGEGRRRGGGATATVAWGSARAGTGGGARVRGGAGV
jgi:hypothetical protein